MQIVQTLLRTTAMAALAGASTLCLHAQQGSAGSQSQSSVAPATLLAANDAPSTIGYSSSAGAEETAAATSYIVDPGTLSSDPGGQPPPRRYGRRPVYADSHHNADGSAKYTFFGGGGFTVPTGGTHAYLSPNYDLQVGGGRNFNRKLALVAQFDYDRFGIQSNTLNNLLLEYQSLGATDGSGNTISQVGGNTHVWSFTLDPMYTYYQGNTIGAYVIGGVGFYHKVTDFTTPAVGEYCDPYYGCYEYQANQTIDSYVSNSVGFNGGVGATYKPSRFGDLKLYAEARYVYTANQARPFYDGSTANPTSNANYFDVFPQNSAKTTFIPVTFGVRF